MRDGPVVRQLGVLRFESVRVHFSSGRTGSTDEREEHLGAAVEVDVLFGACVDAGSELVAQDVVANDQIVVQVVDDEEINGPLLPADPSTNSDFARGLAFVAKPADELVPPHRPFQ